MLSLSFGRAGLDGAFQSIVDGHQVENPKPFPDVYIETAADYKVRSRQLHHLRGIRPAG